MTPTIHVFTYKDGLLARLAHDLRLELRRFEVRREGTAITGTFWPGSLAVEGPVRDGVVDAAAFSAGDRAKIAENIAEVLMVGRHPVAELEAEVDAERRIRGRLTLAGRTQPISTVARVDGGTSGSQNSDRRLFAEVTLTPSLWGIAPYRALAGAIKLQDRVVVRVSLPIRPHGPPGLSAGPGELEDPCVWSAG